MSYLAHLVIFAPFLVAVALIILFHEAGLLLVRLEIWAAPAPIAVLERMPTEVDRGSDLFERVLRHRRHEMSTLEKVQGV